MRKIYNLFFIFIYLTGSSYLWSNNIKNNDNKNTKCIYNNKPIDLSSCIWYAKLIQYNEVDNFIKIIKNNDIANLIHLNQYKKIEKFPVLLNQIFPIKEYGKLRYYILYIPIQISTNIENNLILEFPVIGENYKILWNQNLLHSEWYIENNQIKKYRTIKDLKVVIDTKYIKHINYLILLMAGYTPLTKFNKNDDIGIYINNGYILKEESEFYPDIKFFYTSFFIGMYLFIGVLLLLFFLFLRNISFLFLSLFCLVISIYYIAGDPILFMYFPNIGSDLLNKLEYTTVILLIPIFIAYIRHNYFNKTVKLLSFFGIYFYLILLISLINLFIDFKISKVILNIWQIHALFAILYIIILSFIAIIKNKKDSLILFAGILIVAIAAIYDILASIYLFTPLRITMYLFAFFIFILAMLLARNIVSENKKFIKSLEDQKILLNVYKKFFPEKILKIINKENIEDLKFNEYFKINSIILVSDLRDFTSLTEIYGGGKIFKTLNQFYNIIEKLIREYEGEIVDFYGDQYIAIFPFKGEKNADFIIDLIYKIENIKSQFEIPLKHGYGIEYGYCYLNFIGSSNVVRLAISGIDIEDAKFYEKITKFYETLIICSEDFYQYLNQYKEEFLPVEIIPDNIILSKQLYYKE
ncbi:MAG: hypothetical protein KatS3mg129_0150 [Leptospiraceae bacterium]|nr:MAG: hypothetical protein KatS3mg129_0150 [Leptospiraceae bacterium]